MERRGVPMKAPVQRYIFGISKRPYPLKRVQLPVIFCRHRIDQDQKSLISSELPENPKYLSLLRISNHFQE